MHDHASWSLSLGRWGSVHVRLHMLFLLFATLTFWLSWRERQANNLPSFDWLVAQCLVVLFLSVALHEIGHTVAAWRLGGSVRCVVLGPLGGLTSVQEMRDHRRELITHLAGPAVNLAICLLCAPILLATSGNLLGLLAPLAPVGLTDSGGFSFLVPIKLCFWINWTLLLVNVLPVFPFDGGRALRSAILLRWPEAGRRGASYLVATVAKFVAVGVFVAALFLDVEDVGSLMPMRFALILLSIFLFFSSKHEERQSDADDDRDQRLDPSLTTDLSELEQEFARNPQLSSGPLQRWLDRRREVREERRSALEAYEEQRADELLARLHKHGMDSLSPEDKHLLERVSARFRNRQRS